MREGGVGGVAWVSGWPSSPVGGAVGGVAGHHLPTGEGRGRRQGVIVGVGGGHCVGLGVVAVFPARYTPVKTEKFHISISIFFLSSRKC